MLSPLTAKTHVARLFSKLDARDRAQLVVIAYETGLVVPGGADVGVLLEDAVASRRPAVTLSDAGRICSRAVVPFVVPC